MAKETATEGLTVDRVHQRPTDEQGDDDDGPIGGEDDNCEAGRPTSAEKDGRRRPPDALCEPRDDHLANGRAELEGSHDGMGRHG